MSEETQGVAPSPDDNADSSTATVANTEGNPNVEAGATENTETPKKRNGVQERINKLTTEKYEVRQRNAELEERIRQLEASQPAAVEPATPILAAPNEDNFNTHEEYLAAQAKFVADTASNAAYERIRAEQEAANSAKQQEQQQSEILSKKKAFDDNVAKKRDNFEDFEEVAYGHKFMDKDLAVQIFEMDKGPEVAYHLGSNLDVAERVFSMSPVQRARELTKLEFQLDAISPKVVSDAPDPINPLGNSELVEADPDKMSADQWLAWRNKKLYG
jgi:hypothetical protein